MTTENNLNNGWNQYPPSVQNILVSYLKPEQKQKVCNVLRVLKKHAQMELCISLLDYIESGNPAPPENAVLEDIFWNMVENETVTPNRV